MMALPTLKKNNAQDVLEVLPSVSIYQKDNHIILTLEMPGVVKDSLDVSLDGQNLTVRGRRAAEEVAKEYRPLYLERQPVAYRRTFELNTEIDREKTTAHYADGVLKVILVKALSSQPRKIQIQT